MGMEQDPRIRRLVIEQERLINLASRSDLIHIEPVDAVPGIPPDKYLIAYTCKGIARIDERREPVASNLHQVSMYISREFPRQEPFLRWLTPIWHPNIEHEEPRHVCTNNVQNFYSTKGLDDLLVTLGEMVQYKRYHALWQEPWPLDKEVADWVVNFAEPRGIVGQNKPFDVQPLVRVYKIRVRSGGDKSGTGQAIGSNPSSPRTKREGLKLGARRPTFHSPPVRKNRIKFGPKRNS
jgi:ubiquitin-protein ligase